MIQNKIKQRGSRLITKKQCSLLSLFGVIASIAVGYLCKSSSRSAIPDRPESVPKDAVLVGGADGGCFICIQSEFADTSNFAIYNDISGELWNEGFFICEKSDFESIKSSDWYDLLIGYDGDKIMMENPRNQQQYILWKKL